MKARIIAFALVSACAAWAGPPLETEVTVVVKDPYDKPVDNAAVVMDFLGSKQVAKLGRRKRTHWEVHTNEAGFAKFPAVPQGTLRVQVIAPNYQTFGDKFDIDQTEKEVDVKLKPPQPQYSAHPPLKPADRSATPQ
ncbi:MAG: carboxypeptidase-like regulatory domain-containing protein [Bryobacteraceae bacterium]